MCLLAALGSLFFVPAAAVAVDEDAKLTTLDNAMNDLLGRSVSISGDTALIGAPEDTNDNGGFAGAAYVFRFDGSAWVEEAKLITSDGVIFDEAGRSVSISGDLALIGVNRDDDDGAESGSAYIFRFDGINWVEEAKLTASDGAAGDEFGMSVSISGDTALVGAHEDDGIATDSGAAYVFRFDGASWVQEMKFTDPVGAERDRFGQTVSIFGDTALVGGSSVDAAYLYRYDGTDWLEEARLTANDPAAADNFGSSVSIFGGTALVGASLDNNSSGVGSGTAYVFRYDGTDWNFEAKLEASDGAAGDVFGISVSTTGDQALVGAFGAFGLAQASGLAYVFDFDGNGWVEESRLIASDGGFGEQFGISVSLSGNTALVGAPHHVANGSRSGSAYVFVPEPSMVLLQTAALLALVGCRRLRA